MLPVMLVDVPSAAREGSRRDANRVVGFAGSKASYREACSRKGRIQTVHDARWGVLAAGTAAGSLTGGLHGGKKQTDENADDRDHGKQFHERKRTAIPSAPSMPPSWWRAKSWTQRIATDGKHPCSPETVFSRKPRRSLPDFSYGSMYPLRHDTGVVWSGNLSGSGCTLRYEPARTIAYSERAGRLFARSPIG